MGDVLIGDRRGSGPLVRLVTAAAPSDGHGHLSRALALGGALGRAGATVELELLRGELTGAERGRLAGARLSVLRADSPVGADVAAVVVDLPDLAAAVDRFDAARLIVFDDRALFGGRAAVVVQPSMPRWTGPGTARRVLAGYAYAPVAEAYRQVNAKLASASPPAPDERPRLVACFGGSDPADVMGRIGPGLATDPRWTVELVVGAAYRGSMESWPTPAVRDPADLPGRLAAADLVLIGAGTMKFEVACLGRPAIMLAVADDQLSVGPPFAATGAADYLGDGRTIDPELVRAAVARLLADPPRRAAMARTARDLVDGDGARRIAEAVLAVAGRDTP